MIFIDLMKLLSFPLEFCKKIVWSICPNKHITLSDNKSPMSKTFITGGTSLEINSVVKQKSELVTQKARVILKTYINEPEKIFEFIEQNGTNIIKAPFMDKVLKLIGEEEGFITPVKGINAILLIMAINILSAKKLPYTFKTAPMFIMRNQPFNIFSMAHQLHHWLAYNENLPGYEENTLKNFKVICVLNSNSSQIKKLSVQEIISLKNAIARDVEAIAFVKSFTREYEGSKESLNKIKEGQAVNI